MKPYLSFFRIRFLAGLQYRAAAWAGVTTQFAWGFLQLLLYRAFFRADSAAFPMEFRDLATYIWLQQALLALFMSWFYDSDIFDTIETGGVAYELCRPCDLYTMWFAKNVAIRTARVALRCGPVLLVAAMLPAPYGVTLPVNWAAAVLFAVSAVLGVLVLVAFNMLVYLSAFHTLSSQGVRTIVNSVMEFFTGALIPIPFFPPWLQEILYALPFGSMQSTPFLIYTGYLDAHTALERMGVQALWLAALVGIGKIWMRFALRRTVVQGG